MTAEAKQNPKTNSLHRFDHDRFSKAKNKTSKCPLSGSLSLRILGRIRSSEIETLLFLHPIANWEVVRLWSQQWVFPGTGSRIYLYLHFGERYTLTRFSFWYFYLFWRIFEISFWYFWSPPPRKRRQQRSESGQNLPWRGITRINEWTVVCVGQSTVPQYAWWQLRSTAGVPPKAELGAGPLDLT